MINVSIELLTNWQRHPLHGLNAIAQWLPRDGFNGRAADPAPPLVSIIGDFEDAKMAETLDPPKLPAFGLWVDRAEPLLWKGKQAYLVTIAGAYCTAANVDALTSIVECGYILRAARLCMLRYLMTGFSEATGEPNYRQHNGVRVMDIQKCIEARRTATSKGRKTKMWGFLDIEAVVIDGISRLPPTLPPVT